MRTLILAGLTMVTALGSAGAADAQRLGQPGAPYPVPGRMPQPGVNGPVNLPSPPPMAQQMPSYPTRAYPGPRPMQANRPYPNGPRPMQGQMQGSRWGNGNGGRWAGGTYAPGGWNAYHRPSRGWRVPNYWNSPSFYIGDYAGYGLGAPPSGYGWHRYYDDAVLIDARGKVWDSRGGIDWDGAGYGDGYSRYEYDRSYGGGYPLPPQVQQGAVTTYSTSSGYAGGGGYYAGGYYYPGATTTVVTIQSAPVVTTTTTEYIEETRTRYIAPRRVYHAPKKHYYRPRCSCRKVVEKPILGS